MKEKWKTYWNYRVVRRKFVKLYYDETTYGIHEVYYGEGGNPKMISESPIYPYGESVAELKDDISRMLMAFEKPVLDYNSLEEVQDESPD